MVLAGGLAVGPAAPAAAAGADHPVVAVVTTDPSLPQPDDGGAAYLADVRTQLADLRTYWEDQSDGNVLFSQDGDLRWYPGEGSCTADRGEQLRRLGDKAGYRSGPRRHLLLVVANCSDGAGTGTQTGSPDAGGSVFLPSLRGKGTYGHEFGHNLGIGHANLLVCSDGSDDAAIGSEPGADPDCTSGGYGDSLDIMGTTRTSQYKNLSAPLRTVFGWLAPGRAATFSGAGVDQTRTLQARDAEDGLITVQATDPVTGRTYWVELASTTGDDAAVGGGSQSTGGQQFQRGSGVRVLRLQGTSHATLLMPGPEKADGVRNLFWTAGQTFRTAGGGLTIEVLRSGGGTADVRVRTSGGGAAAADGAAGTPADAAASAAATATPTATAAPGPLLTADTVTTLATTPVSAAVLDNDGAAGDDGGGTAQGAEGGDGAAPAAPPAPLDPGTLVLADVGLPEGAVRSADGLRLEVPGEGDYVVDPAAGTVTMTPAAGFTGEAQAVVYQVADTGGALGLSTLTVTVADEPAETAAPVTAAAVAAGATTVSPGGTSAGPVLVAVAGALLVVGGFLGVLWRRRRQAEAA